MPSLESHEKRITNLEKKDVSNDGRFQNIHTKIDEHRKSIDNELLKISNSLDTIKDGQHNQALLNQKMDWTLTTINDEREREREAKYAAKKETKKDMKAIRNMILGMLLTLVGTFLWTLIQMWLGI